MSWPIHPKRISRWKFCVSIGIPYHFEVAPLYRTALDTVGIAMKLKMICRICAQNVGRQCDGDGGAMLWLGSSGQPDALPPLPAVLTESVRSCSSGPTGAVRDVGQGTALSMQAACGQCG